MRFRYSFICQGDLDQKTAKGWWWRYPTPSERWGRPDSPAPRGVVLPFRPTSRIEGRGPHHHVEAAKRWCSSERFVSVFESCCHLLLPV